MSQKSISEFRAENNITLQALSEMTGISVEELKKIGRIKARSVGT